MQTLRLAGMLQAFQQAILFVLENPRVDKFQLKESLLRKLDEASLSFVVTESALKKAVELLGYFNKQKLIFCGYEAQDWSLDYLEVIEELGTEIEPSHAKEFCSFRAQGKLVIVQRIGHWGSF